MKLLIITALTGDAAMDLRVNEAKMFLDIAGYEPVFVELEDEMSSQLYLRKALLALVDECAGVAVLPDWKHSQVGGTVVESAIQIGKPVKELDRWMAQVVVGEAAGSTDFAFDPTPVVPFEASDRGWCSIDDELIEVGQSVIDTGDELLHAACVGRS